jgi:hypothetical protein
MGKAQAGWTFVALLVLMSTWAAPAEAYVDPGSASYAFQVIAGMALGAMFLVRTYWSRLVAGIRSLVSRDAAHNE